MVSRWNIVITGIYAAKKAILILVRYRGSLRVSPEPQSAPLKILAPTRHYDNSLAASLDTHILTHRQLTFSVSHHQTASGKICIRGGGWIFSVGCCLQDISFSAVTRTCQQSLRIMLYCLDPQSNWSQPKTIMWKTTEAWSVTMACILKRGIT